MPISQSATQPTINISYSALVADEFISQCYATDTLQKVLVNTLDFMNIQQKSGLTFPYYQELDIELWLATPKELDVYITDLTEAKALNNEARGKDYATNILSYPSDLPPFILLEMPTIPLGELIICHDVVVTEAKEQNKTVSEHATHLLVHGILHLLGFDHELGQAEQNEMEGFEIAILAKLGINNPYLSK